MKRLDYPTAFTPNANDVNDRFRGILNGDCEITAYHLMVFNRWGEKVFETTTWNEGWDGVFEQENQETMMFTWHVEYQVEGSEKLYEQSGGVTLIR